jgi:hypothetical protein
VETKTPPTLYGGRIVNGNLQSAVQEYRHPDGRSILLVGLVHLAEPDYFAEIRKITEEVEESGATVLFEGVRGRTEDREMSDEERSAIIALDQALDTKNKEIVRLFGLPWVDQDDSVLSPCFPRWEPADTNVLDVVRLFGPKNATMVAPLAAHLEHYKQLKETHGEHSAAFKKARDQFVMAVAAAANPSRDESQYPGIGWMIPIIFTYREYVAALRTLETKGDIALLWHPGHMIHLGQIFVRYGFEPSETVEWLTAFNATQTET